MFATTKTFLPSIASKETWPTSPLTTCRGPPASPTSISSTNSFSASGCCQTFVIVPTFICRRDTSVGNTARYFLATGTGRAFSFVSFVSLDFFSPPPPTSPSASCFAKSMSPTCTGVPGVRFWPFLSLQMGTGGVLSFSKIAAAARGINGDKKCAATYAASRVARMICAFFNSAPSPFTAHGALSVRNLFVSFTAFIASSQASCVLKPVNAISVCARKSGTSTTEAVPNASGTFPSQFFKHKFVARCTRFPKTSARSLLCVSTSACSENGMSLPYTPPRIK
mmetsp:Transcript_14175/g.46989  ORF Transcript_14175/g.46989 Transcript_14175/m.46989 type:complete len:281 (+) Transcript_14175:269-1111(+)